MSGSYVPGQGLPVALPLGSSADGPVAQVSDTFPPLTETNTPYPMVTEHPDRRLSRRALEQLETHLPVRDRQVLGLVADHRFLTTGQLEQFVFTTHSSPGSAARTARQVLSRLERSLLLSHLERRVGGVRAGSSGHIWQLTSGAARLLRDEGLTFRKPEPSPRFLLHCLAVGDVHLVLRSLRGELITDIEVQVEPASWRNFTGPGGEHRSLQPDLAAVVHAESFEERWFLEVDLGTESLPTILKKCAQYESYRATGIEQAEHGVFPLVWWIFTRTERATRLTDAVRRTRRLTPDLYRIVTIGQLEQSLTEALR
jgi:hypothetical protein